MRRIGTWNSVLSFEMAASMWLSEPHHKGILIGLWEGVVLFYFLSSRSKDPYLALATRLAIDLYLTLLTLSIHPPMRVDASWSTPRRRRAQHMA